MIVFAAFLAGAIQAEPTLSYSNRIFTINDGDTVHTVALDQIQMVMNPTADSMKVEIGESVITFDNRGLGLHYADKGGYTGLPAYTNTRKLWTVEEIQSNVALINEGMRSDRLNAISGYELIEDDLYILARWDDKNGDPWLEALVQVNIEEDTPALNLLGRFDGFTFAKGPVSDVLVNIDGNVAALVQGRNRFWPLDVCA